MNNSSINVNDNVLAKKALSFIFTMVFLFVPSSLFSFLGVKSDILLNLLITFAPSLFYGLYFSIILLYRLFRIKRPLKCLMKKQEYVGKGFYFLNLTSFIKENIDTLNQKASITPELFQSKFKSSIEIKYNIFSNSLVIKTFNQSYGENSSHSKSAYCHLEFDDDDHNNFLIYYGFKNKANKDSDLNSPEIKQLKDFVGHAKIEVVNGKIFNFSYVSDFINRFSFGTYLVNEDENIKKEL